ncbi:hypothetical protein BDQ94DRAFT_183139 [Aspergillus welwitschiae]|uniref:Zn(2)-C6 fungal-type domain-containing protein n=1 Tax=Aspergillus welwitschiae TaxID=1341132 RepID=A0A3F3PPS8_9EURO|nr:hypothetical protein BDQ94DRAFT_183139 [Aspergillus welwitschiae]RDH28843.1 hypothetical protein BDQ94DRAFT_183139 [Aspergillus welwitschiae]
MDCYTSRRRKRTRLSCVECHRRKVRCDRSDPCRRCSKAKIRCFYDTDDRPRASWSHERSLANDQVSVRQSSTVTTGLPSHALRDTSGSHIGAQEIPLSPLGHSPEASVRGTMSKSRLFGTTHPITTYLQCDEIYSANSSLHSAGRRDSAWSALLVEAQTLIASSKAMARTAKKQYACGNPTLDDAARALPPPEVCDVVVGHYMRIWEGPFRILHRVAFQREYSTFWEDSTKRRPIFTIILCLVMSIGVHFCHDENIEARIRPHILLWLHVAQSWLSNARGKDLATISGLQTQCLLSVSLQFNEANLQRIWLAQGVLLRNAMYMGLHRDGRHFPDMPFYHVEMRRRLWSTILELDLQVTLDLGMVPTTSEHEFDSLPPMNLDDEVFNETTKAAPTPAANSAPTDSSLQITLRRTLVHRMMIARLMNDSFNEPSYEDILQATNELTKLLSTTKQRLDVLVTEGKARAAHQNLIDFLTRRFLIAMHRPFATKAFQDRRYHYSRQVCLDNALLILTPEHDPDFHRMLLTSVTLFRHIMHHAAISLCLEIMGQIKEDQLDKKLFQIRQQDRSRLLASVQQIPQITAERLRLRETNVKSHVFHCMAIAQIEALENGLDVTGHVLTASVASARQALEILQQRVTTNKDEGDHVFSVGSELELAKTDEFLPPTLFRNDDTGFDLGEMTSWLFSDWVEEYPL